MLQKVDTMQTEEVDEEQHPEMTYIETASSSDDSKVKCKDINLEDDIERVEVSSRGTNSDEESPHKFFPEQNPNESVKHWLQRISEFQKKLKFEQSDLTMKNPTTPTPNRVVKYQDLPYMGEMTLDNSKPRRGRKPKKADICHLIYKNYGTIFPGTPNPKNYTEPPCKKSDNKEDRNEVQNRIISSLLEKRLTQDVKKTECETLKPNEPLNLCIRDLNHLKIRLLKKNDTFTSEPIKSEPNSDDDVEFLQESPSVVKKEVNLPTTPESTTPSPDIKPEGPGGYVYWPNAGVFIHPMALQQQLMYYQRMAQNNNCTIAGNSRENPVETSQELRKLVPKHRTKKVEDVETQEKIKRASTTLDKTPTKRKRSAIFIPPIPTENNTNPATEVSICKFKFTGGAKPSLQEKKMLSVDSGGNFRYYSGTGDKSMRGYEFFPRETLQQQVNSTQGSSTGAFLQASGEKIYPGPDFAASQNPEFILTPEIAATPQDLQVQRHKKRKSRKSLQREKLEQTFKEKGFLIQTQQLESAEGATYCKFRQLRKFTRYLFRSWKDYLPGNVRELQDGEKEEELPITEQDLDNISRHSSELNNIQL